MSHARKESASGMYHVTCHGIADCHLFLDDADNKRYLALLRKYLKEYEIEMHAWCLMGNHVHLLPRVPSHAALSSFMRDLNSSYVRYFEKKYERKGQLLQRSFFSKPVDSDAYFLTVLRYIHQNPLKPRLSPTCDYRWSSYQEYVGKWEPVIATTDLALDMFGSVEAFVAFHDKVEDADGTLDPTVKASCMTPEELHAKALRLLGATTCAMLQGAAHDERRAAFQALRDFGFTTRQIAAATGIPYSTVSYTLRLAERP